MAKTERKGNAGFVVLILSVLLILCAIALVAFDAFGLRSRMLFPSLVSPLSALNEVAITDNFAENVLIHTTQSDLDDLIEKIERLEQKNARLREFEAAHAQFQQHRDEFYRNIADDNPEAFMEFFVTFNPALAEEIFRDFASTHIAEEEWQNYLASWGAMNPLQVAMIIEDMLTTHMPLIVKVMSELPESFRGMVLNNLSVESA